MIINAEEGRIYNRDDLSELTVLNYAFRYFESEYHQTNVCIGSSIQIDSFFGSSGGTYAAHYNQINELIFKFENDRLVICADGVDITTDLKSLDFIFRRINPTYTITTTSSGSILDPTDVNMLMNVPEDCIVQVNHVDAKMNGVRDLMIGTIREMAFRSIPLYPNIEMMDFTHQLIWYCFPLARFFSENVPFEGIAKQFVDKIGKNRAINESLFSDYFLSKDLHEVCMNLVGCNSKKIIKYLAENSIQNNVKIAKNITNSTEPLIISNGSDTSVQFNGLSTGEVIEYPMYIRFRDFEIINQLSNVFCLDHVHEIIDSGVIPLLPKLNYSHPFFDNFSKRKLVNLFKAGFSEHDFSDTVNQYNDYSDLNRIPEKIRYKYPNGIKIPNKFRTIKELHDNISRQYREIKAEADNVTIPYLAQEFKLHGAKFKNFELVLPSEASTLVEWGGFMDNCIAGYGGRAAKKELILIGVKKNGTLFYNIQLNPKYIQNPQNEERQIESGRISQFYSYNNNRPMPDSLEEDKKDVINLISAILQADIEESNNIFTGCDARLYIGGQELSLAGTSEVEFAVG